MQQRSPSFSRLLTMMFGLVQAWMIDDIPTASATCVKCVPMNPISSSRCHSVTSLNQSIFRGGINRMYMSILKRQEYSHKLWISKYLVLFIFAALFLFCIQENAAAEYANIPRYPVPRIAQKDASNGGYSGGNDCYVCSLASVQAYFIGGNNYSYGGYSRTYTGAYDYDWSTDPLWKKVYDLNNGTYIYDASLAKLPYPMRKISYPVSDTLQGIYDILLGGSPCTVHYSDGTNMHASVVIGYEGNGATVLKASDFIVMEIKITGTMAKYFTLEEWMNRIWGTTNLSLNLCYVTNPPFTPGTVVPTVDDIQVLNVTSSGYTLTCSVSENVTRVAFPTWTSADWQDDIIWRDGQISNGVATFNVSTSEHGYQSGEYLTYVYAYDSAGNVSVENDSTRIKVDVPQLIAQIDRNQDGIYCVGETVHITPSDTSFDTYWLRIIRTPTGGETYEYWNGQLSGKQYDFTPTLEGYYACCFYFPVDGQYIETGWVGWSVHSLQAQVDRGQSGFYCLGETVHISPNATSLDSCSLRIIRTPVGGVPDVDTYVYWEGTLQSQQYDLMLTESGYYACCYIVSINGQNIESAWVGWNVVKPDLILPAGLTTIESEAFAGINAAVVLVPDGCKSIGSLAFANCPNLQYVLVNDLSAIEIAADAFAGTEAKVIDR